MDTWQVFIIYEVGIRFIMYINGQCLIFRWSLPIRWYERADPSAVTSLDRGSQNRSRIWTSSIGEVGNCKRAMSRKRMIGCDNALAAHSNSKRSSFWLRVLDWEGNLRPREEVVAVVDHLTIIIIEEDTPSSNNPASHHGSDGVSVDGPVEEVISKWGSTCIGTSDHGDCNEGNDWKILSSGFHFRFY